MADRLEDLLRSCVVRVISGTTSGAGFFIAPGKVITCAHVVQAGSSAAVHWEHDGRPSAEFAVSDARLLADRGRPIPALASDYPDIALLTVRGIASHPCAAIDDGWPGSADVFQAFGYPSEGGAALLTPAKLTYRGPRGTWPTLFLDLGWDIIRHGMSGAPVLNLRTGGVCGVVVASRDPQQLAGALAVPWSAVAADLDDVLAANAAFHKRDGRWAAVRPQPAGATARPAAPGGGGTAATRARTAGAGAAGWAAGARHGAPDGQPGHGPDSRHDDEHDEHDEHHDRHHDGDQQDDDQAAGHQDDDAYADDDGGWDADDSTADLSETDDDDLW